MKNKRATIKDVAALAETSVSVVSYVLNNTPGKSITDKTKERVFAAAKELSYVPNSTARALRTGSGKAIAFFAFWNTEDNSYNKFLAGLTHSATKKGYNIILCDTASLSKTKLPLLCLQLNVSGIIVLSAGNPYFDYHGTKEQEIVKALENVNVPSLIINGEGDFHDSGIDSLYFGFFEAASNATSHLIKSGCKNIAYIKDEINSVSETDRLKGFYSALSFSGLSAHSVVTTKNINALFKKDMPDGVVTNKSDAGYLFLKAAKEKGIKVPEEIKVIAANNEGFAEYLEPPLTTVSLPLKDLGKTAAYKIINRVENQKNQLPVLEYKVIIRKSV